MAGSAFAGEEHSVLEEGHQKAASAGDCPDRGSKPKCMSNIGKIRAGWPEAEVTQEMWPRVRLQGCRGDLWTWLATTSEPIPLLAVGS